MYGVGALDLGTLTPHYRAEKVKKLHFFDATAYGCVNTLLEPFVARSLEDIAREVREEGRLEEEE